MKKIYYLVAFILTTIANAQTISPATDAELCPEQQYSFTVTGLPAAYLGITSTSYAFIINSPVINGSSITFNGKFQDVNSFADISFTVSYTGGSKKFRFTRVKSLFGGYREATNLPTTINAPICQTTPISLNLIGNQYLDSSVSPNIAFGSITNYRYQIPSGWYLNSTLSNGSTWITANGSVTLTPDSSTSGVVNYIAKSDCSNAFIEGSQRTIYK